jgi:hypothetical protein
LLLVQTAYVEFELTRPGSHDHAASVAARRALDAGYTRLGIALITHVASRGVNFQTDAEIQGEIRRPDGRAYHRESIGRMRRLVTERGALSAKRLYPGQRPPGAKFRTSHGVVVTTVVWGALRVADPPRLRGSRSAERREARRPGRERMTPAEVIEGARGVLRLLERDDPPERPT